MIRVALCDDDALVRQLLSQTLTNGDIEVVGTVPDGESALAFEEPVDLWLVDLRMPGIDGRETTRLLVEADPDVKVILLTAFGDGEVAETMRAGASGYLNKDANPDQLRHAIRSVMDGFLVVTDGSLGEALLAPKPHVSDDICEDDVDRRIVELLTAGYSYGDIAKDIEMSVSGTKKRAARLMQAVGAASRSELVAKVHGFR